MVKPADVLRNFTGSGIPVADVGFAALPAELPRLASLHPGEWMYERIARSIIKFEKQLDPDKEVGARLVNFASGETISVSDVGYWGTDLIIFYGKTIDGYDVELLQHISQVNVLLVAMPAKGEPKRIGFLLEQQLEKKGSE